MLLRTFITSYAIQLGSTKLSKVVPAYASLLSPLAYPRKHTQRWFGHYTVMEKAPTYLLSNHSLLFSFSSRSSVSLPFSNRTQMVNISTSPRALKQFRIRMDEAEKKKQMADIEKMKKEEKPQGAWALLKYYTKRYWYIAIPVHALSCITWFTIAFVAVKSGVDVVAILDLLHVPEYLIEKVKNTSPSAGVAVIAFVLYKIATPLRYATTLAGIKLTFTTLKKMGKLKTAKEVSYQMRTAYAKRADRLKRRYSRFTKVAVKAMKRRAPLANGKNGKNGKNAKCGKQS